MKRRTKKIFSLLSATLGVTVISIGAAIGITSCSSTETTSTTSNGTNTTSTAPTNNSSQTNTSITNQSNKNITNKNNTASISSTNNSSNSTKTSSSSSNSTSSSSTNNSSSSITSSNHSSSSTNNTNSSSSNSANPSSSSSSTTSSSNKKDTNGTSNPNDSSNNKNDNAPDPYPNGMVTITSALTNPNVGQETSTNEYACGSSITLSAHYTYPTIPNLYKDGSFIFNWYDNNNLIGTTSSPTYVINNLIANGTYSVSVNYSYILSSTDLGSYNCTSNQITNTVNYDDINLNLSHNDGSTSTITTTNPTTLDATLSYTLPGTNEPTLFTSSQLSLLPAATLSFSRYDFNTWNSLQVITDANSKQTNFEQTFTPDGIYPFKATLTFNNQTISSNILKVNTNYNGTVLNFSNLPTSVANTYNYPMLMQKYILQSMDEPNSLFMQLVNTMGQGYRIIPVTTNNSMTATQFNQLKVSANDFKDVNVKWFDAKNHDDGLLVSATINIASGLELYWNQNYNDNYNDLYQASVTQPGNYKITDGNTISWLLPYGNNELNWWSQNPTTITSQNINWNANANIYSNGLLFNNYEPHATKSNWYFYTPSWGYSSISFSTIAPGVYWGFTITTPSGSNALKGILYYDNSQYNNGNYYQAIYGSSNNASYAAYSYFPMIQSNATSETGYLTLLSSCNQMLSDLYNLSIQGINTLN